MKFTKMHGLGNDYVYVNCFEEKIDNPPEVAKFVSDRHTGIGSDGLIMINPSKVADCEMEMYNADGSRGEMCGNGVRCVGKYVYDYGITDKTSISVETLGGIKYLDFTIEDGKVKLVRVDMGAPVLKPELIPIVMDDPELVMVMVNTPPDSASPVFDTVPGIVTSDEFRAFKYGSGHMSDICTSCGFA